MEYINAFARTSGKVSCAISVKISVNFAISLRRNVQPYIAANMEHVLDNTISLLVNATSGSMDLIVMVVKSVSSILDCV